MTKAFAVNVDVKAILQGEASKRTYTWDTSATTDLSLMLNTCADFEARGWSVGLECPVPGVQRNYRVPVVAVKQSTVLVIKSLRDPKKVDASGLKLIDIKVALSKTVSDLQIRPVVYGFMASFDEKRRSSDEYEVWLRG